MLVKPLRVNSHNQKHRGCPTRGTAVRGFEHIIIYKRWDDESKVRQEGSLLSFGIWEEAEKRVTMRRWGMRSCERCCQACMAWFGGTTWKKTGRDDVSTYKVALIAVSNRRVG